MLGNTSDRKKNTKADNICLIKNILCVIRVVKNRSQKNAERVIRICENNNIEFLLGNISDTFSWKREERITFRLISGKHVVWNLSLYRISGGLCY